MTDNDGMTRNRAAAQDRSSLGRRGMLRAMMAGATLVAAGSALGSTGCAQDEPGGGGNPGGGGPAAKRIDTHHHVLPPTMKAWMEAEGLLEHVRDQPWTRWELGETLRWMDEHGTQFAVASQPAPSDVFEKRNRAEVGVRILNDSLSVLARENPTRFGFFAYLPLAHVDIALGEIARAGDLGADGFMLMNHFKNKYLGDPTFEPLFAALNERRAVIMTHPDSLPAEAPGGSDVSPAIEVSLADFMLDTTRGALGMMLSGTLDRYPNISVILPHGGGFLPYIGGRMSQDYPRKPVLDPERARAYLRRFYYDTAGPMSPYMTPSLLASVDPSRILFGTDYNQVKDDASAFLADPALDERTRAAIGRDNALRLFPNLARRIG